MMGFVYAITDGRGRVKIGWSSDPFRRLAKIRSDCPSAASLLGLIPATRAQEIEVHKLLAPWRANREWFRHEGAVIDFIGMLPKPLPKLAKKDGNDHPLAVWRRENDHSRESLGKLLGNLPFVTIWRWECDHRMPNRTSMRRIKEVTGLSAAAFYEAAE